MKHQIKIPKLFVGNIAKYKVLIQTLELEYLEDYLTIIQNIVIKIPFWLSKTKAIYDIYDICKKMTKENYKVNPMGWSDSSCKTYEIMIIECFK